MKVLDSSNIAYFVSKLKSFINNNYVSISNLEKWIWICGYEGHRGTDPIELADCNSVTRCGIHVCGISTKNTPASYGILFAFGQNYNTPNPSTCWRNQLYFTSDASIYSRCQWNNGNWTSWRKVTMG